MVVDLVELSMFGGGDGGALIIIENEGCHEKFPRVEGDQSKVLGITRKNDKGWNVGKINTPITASHVLSTQIDRENVGLAAVDKANSSGNGGSGNTKNAGVGNVGLAAVGSSAKRDSGGIPNAGVVMQQPPYYQQPFPQQQTNSFPQISNNFARHKNQPTSNMKGQKVYGHGQEQSKQNDNQEPAPYIVIKTRSTCSHL
uniref:Uncharacterized protein n=1 Tax=Solanum lycopersicum TaxID=4081 RepID=K4BHI0_SOLLC